MKDLIEQYHFELMQAKTQNYFAEYYDGYERIRFPRLAALVATLVWRVQFALCNRFGHDFTTNGCDYVEDGGEGFTCERCGYSFTAWH
jgi:hypothetical protein